MTARLLPVAALLLAACGGTAATGPVSDAAIAAAARPEAQFRAILPRVIFTTQSMGVAAYSLGVEGRCALVRPAFEAAIARHLPVWRANLIKAYRDNVPAATLESALAGGAAGREALRPFIGKIAAQMQADSEPVLEQAAQDIVKPMMDEALKIDPKSIDGAARLQELKAAGGGVYCGLLQPEQETRR